MSNTLAELQPLGKHQSAEIHSVGLEIGPDFFLWYSFADFDALTPLGVNHLALIAPARPTLPEGAQPAFGIVHTPYCTLVPKALFREEEATHWLHIATAAPENAAVEWVHLYRCDAVMVYSPNPAAQQLAATLFPGLQLHPAAGVLAEATALMHLRHATPAMYLLGKDSLYYAAVWGRDGLLLLHASEYKYREDLRHYLLHCRRTLSLPEQMPVYLLGDAALDAELLTLLRLVIPQVQQGLSANETTVHPNATADELARHFTAYMAPLCGL